MKLVEGYAYHILDEYFQLVNDDNLMKNKEGNNMRPTFFCLYDAKTSLFWMVPMSSQVEKYMAIAAKSKERYGKCTTIVFGGFAGAPNAFLLQNMFPVTEKYIAHVHTVNGNPIPVAHSTQQEIQGNFRQLMALIKRGKKVVFPDVMRLEQIMLKEVALLTPQKQSVMDKLDAAKARCAEQNQLTSELTSPTHKPPKR